MASTARHESTNAARTDSPCPFGFARASCIFSLAAAGITGARTQLPPATAQAVAELRKHTDTPICVGFGVSSPEQVRAVVSAADGAIVGSAIVKRIAAAAEAGKDRAAMVKEVGQFVADLLTATAK